MKAKVLGISKVKVGKNKDKDKIILYTCQSQKGVMGYSARTFFVDPSIPNADKVQISDDIEITFGFNFSVKGIEIINQKG